MEKDFKVLVRDIKESETIKKFAEDMMNFIFTKSQENLIQNGSVDTGFLLRSGKPPKWEGNTLTLGYDAPYARMIEYGTPPHPVSGKHFVAWVRRKLGITDPETARVAWAIATKIKKEGTDPKPFLRPAINDAIAKFGLKIKPIIE